MAKTIRITLGEQDYEVPRLNMGQAEDLADFFEQNGGGAEKLKGKAYITYMINVATVVLSRSAPPIANLRDVECTFEELQKAVGAVLEFSRLQRQDDSGNAPAGESPAA